MQTSRISTLFEISAGIKPLQYWQSSQQAVPQPLQPLPLEPEGNTEEGDP